MLWPGPWPFMPGSPTDGGAAREVAVMALKTVMPLSAYMDA